MYATILNGETFEIFNTEIEAKETAKIMRKSGEYDSTDKIRVKKLY
jgi:hypothetical protein